jgi:hypothetical protein
VISLGISLLTSLRTKRRLLLRDRGTNLLQLGFRPQGRGTIFGPEDVIEGRGLSAVFAETTEALSPVVLAVHNNLGEALGERGLCFEEWQLKSPPQIDL